MSDKLSHLDSQGRAVMVDVSEKAESKRVARAEALVKVSAETYTRWQQGDLPKGDLTSTVRLAGIMGAKKTSELIPLCHPLSLSSIEVELEGLPPDRLRLLSRVSCRGTTGVEMEALTAVSVAALTLYDMVKAIDRAAEIGPIRLLHKSGGKSKDWTRQ